MKWFVFSLLSLFFTATLLASDITVVSLAVGEAYKATVQPGIDNKEAYCKKHGYAFVCGEEWIDPSRPIPWSKVLLVLQIMETSSSEWMDILE